jgi:hypothetical protein
MIFCKISAYIRFSAGTDYMAHVESGSVQLIVRGAPESSHSTKSLQTDYSRCSPLWALSPRRVHSKKIDGIVEKATQSILALTQSKVIEAFGIQVLLPAGASQ